MAHCDTLVLQTFTEAKILFKKILKRIEPVRYRSHILFQKVRNRIPDNVKNAVSRFILPYLSIIIVSSFVMLTNFVQARESSLELLPNENVMDLNPAEVAKAVSAIDQYTPNFQEDAVSVVLAMKDEDYLGKPIITETAKTTLPETGSRKSVINYTVEGGDTLSSIGWQYGLRIATIKSYNNLSSDNIRLGQALKLPPQDLSPSALASASKKVAGASTPTAFKGTFGRPTRGWNMSQSFGRTSFNPNHTGVDLTSRSGTTILASASGRVSKVGRGWGGGYGNHIIITHGNGFTTLYGHMSVMNVSVGQWVNQGQPIGIMGSSGWSTGVHVHFEIRKNNAPQNPLSYL